MTLYLEPRSKNRGRQLVGSMPVYADNQVLAKGNLTNPTLDLVIDVVSRIDGCLLNHTHGSGGFVVVSSRAVSCGRNSE